jgi:hypothetical protein
LTMSRSLQDALGQEVCSRLSHLATIFRKIRRQQSSWMSTGLWGLPVRLFLLFFRDCFVLLGWFSEKTKQKKKRGEGSSAWLTTSRTKPHAKSPSSPQTISFRGPVSSRMNARSVFLPAPPLCSRYRTSRTHSSGILTPRGLSWWRKMCFCDGEHVLAMSFAQDCGRYLTEEQLMRSEQKRLEYEQDAMRERVKVPRPARCASPIERPA